MCKRRGVNMAIRSCHPAPPTLKEFHKNKAVFDDKNESTFIQGNIHLDPQSPCMQELNPAAQEAPVILKKTAQAITVARTTGQGENQEPRTQLSEGWDFLIEKLSFLFYVLQQGFGLLCGKIEKIYHRKMNIGILFYAGVNTRGICSIIYLGNQFL